MRAGGSGIEAPPKGECVLGKNGIVPQELGACYTSPDYVRLMRLLSDLGLYDQLITVPPRMVHPPNATTAEPLAVYTAKFLIDSAAQGTLSPKCEVKPLPAMDLAACGREAAAVCT